jgi:hypothetical protein
MKRIAFMGVVAVSLMSLQSMHAISARLFVRDLITFVGGGAVGGGALGATIGFCQDIGSELTSSNSTTGFASSLKNILSKAGEGAMTGAKYGAGAGLALNVGITVIMECLVASVSFNKNVASSVRY